jgi:hypothetical protein
VRYDQVAQRPRRQWIRFDGSPELWLHPVTIWTDDSGPWAIRPLDPTTTSTTSTSTTSTSTSTTTTTRFEVSIIGPQERSLIVDAGGGSSWYVPWCISTVADLGASQGHRPGLRIEVLSLVGPLPHVFLSAISVAHPTVGEHVEGIVSDYGYVESPPAPGALWSAVLALAPGSDLSDVRVSGLPGIPLVEF